MHIVANVIWQAKCAGNFSLGEKSLVKLTPGVNFINVKRAHILYEFFTKAKMLLEKAAKKGFRM